jgi:hypothetical protein
VTLGHDDDPLSSIKECDFKMTTDKIQEVLEQLIPKNLDDIY